MIIWLVGLSGAGKTAIGRKLYAKMNTKNPATVIIDGDEIREVFKQDQQPADYSLEGRKKNARRIQEICKWLDRQDIDVVCCILSVFPESLSWNRENFREYFEVFVDAPFEDLVERNPKNLYRLALSGEMNNVVGVDIEFVPPENPDHIVFNTRPFRDVCEVANEVFNKINARFDSVSMYPYATGELLSKRNSYTYTPYFGEPFLDSWKDQRSKVLESLETADPSPIDVAADIDDDWSFPVTTNSLLLIMHNRLKAGMFDQKDVVALNNLVQRFEVSKRLYGEYNTSWRALTDSGYHDLGRYVKYAILMDAYYSHTKQFDVLNVFLKVMDTVCAYFTQLTPQDQIRLRHLVHSERKAIHDLQTKVSMR